MPQLPPDDDALVRVEDAAPHLHLHPVGLRRACASGRIPALKIGRRWLIRAGTLRGVMRGEITFGLHAGQGAA